MLLPPPALESQTSQANPSTEAKTMPRRVVMLRSRSISRRKPRRSRTRSSSHRRKHRRKRRKRRKRSSSSPKKSSPSSSSSTRRTEERKNPKRNQVWYPASCCGSRWEPEIARGEAKAQSTRSSLLKHQRPVRYEKCPWPQQTQQKPAQAFHAGETLRQLTMSAGGIGLRRRRDRLKSTKIAGLFIPQDLFKHMFQ